jgi:3-isopropylmalate dehydrogenase
MINSSAMLLEWLGARHDDEPATRAAALIEQAVTGTVKGGVATRDLGGTASTSRFAAAVVDAIGRR